MPRPLGKLAPLDVKQLGQGKHADGGGLYLVVTTTGTRSWAFRYSRAGKAHEMGIGAVHTLGLAEARERARRNRQQLLDGVDPLAQRRAAKAVAFIVLTASRSGEGRGARVGEFNLDGRTWTVPAVRMKNRRPHRVPLAPPGIALVKELIADRQQHDLVSAAPRRGVAFFAANVQHSTS